MVIFYHYLLIMQNHLMDQKFLKQFNSQMGEKKFFYLKKQVTLRLGVDVIDYFKKLAEETGVPYQNLINLYLQDCAHSQKKLKLKWAS